MIGEIYERATTSILVGEFLLATNPLMSSYISCSVIVGSNSLLITNFATTCAPSLQTSYLLVASLLVACCVLDGAMPNALQAAKEVRMAASKRTAFFELKVAHLAESGPLRGTAGQASAAGERWALATLNNREGPHQAMHTACSRKLRHRRATER